MGNGKSFILKGLTGSPHPVDVLRALDDVLGQSGNIKLPTAIRVHFDVQFFSGMLPEQIPAGAQNKFRPETRIQTKKCSRKMQKLTKH